MPATTHGETAGVESRLERWLGRWGPATRAGAHVTHLERASAGWSGDTLLVTVSPGLELDGRVVSELVFRVAPSPQRASFPEEDPAAQAEVMRVLRATGIPAPVVGAVEEDKRWLGGPFIVMVRAEGRGTGDVPALDPWFGALAPQTQRRAHEGFVDALARLHSLDWRESGLGEVLREAGADLAADTQWWARYVDWAADGRPTDRLARFARWCVESAPSRCSPPALCWGDPRVGNVLFFEDGSIAALLDWELASIGPPEMDLGWYLALERLTARIAGTTVPGFLEEKELLARYEERLGREVEHLEWFEIYALVRSVAINERQARLAIASGVPYPGFAGDDNPLLDYLGRLISRFEAGG